MKQLTKQQWLDLFENNELIECVEDKLTFYKSDEIIPSEKMSDLIFEIDFEEEHSDWNCGSYNIDEVIRLYNSFEKNKDFLIKVTKLFE